MCRLWIFIILQPLKNLKEKGLALTKDIKKSIQNTINSLVNCSELNEFEILLKMACEKWANEAPDFNNYFL